MSIINVPVLGSPNDLRRQLRTGVVTDIGEVPHSPIQTSLRRSIRQTLRPGKKRTSVHYDPDDELRPELRSSAFRKRDPTPHPHSPVVRDFAYPTSIRSNTGRRDEEPSVHADSQASSRQDPMSNDNRIGGGSGMSLNRRLGLRRMARKPIPPPRPISFNFDSNNNDTNINAHNNDDDHNRNREPTPIPLLSGPALRQKIAQMRVRQTKQSNPYLNPDQQPIIPIIKPDGPSRPRDSVPNLNQNNLPDPPTLGRGFFGFPDKSRYFNFMRRHRDSGLSALDPPVDLQPPSKRVRFKSISSRISRNTWRKSKTKAGDQNHPADVAERRPVATGPAPVPREISRSRTQSEARRAWASNEQNVPNIDIRPPTPPLLDNNNHVPVSPVNAFQRKGRISIPAIRMPTIRAPKLFGFNKWRNTDSGMDGDLTSAGPDDTIADGVVRPDRPPSITQEQATPAPALPQGRHQHRRPAPVQHDGTSSLRQNHPGSSIRQYVTSSASVQQHSPSLHSNRPPSVRPRVASLPSSRPPSVRQRVTSLQSNRPPSASIQQHSPPRLNDRSSIRERTTSMQSNRPPSPSIEAQRTGMRTRSPTRRQSTFMHRISSLPNQGPAIRPTKERRGGGGRFMTLPEIPNHIRMRMPAIRVWRRRGKGETLEPVDVDVAQDPHREAEAIQLIQTSPRNELTPLPGLVQGTHTTRTVLRATRALLHPLLLTPTLLRPARLHWDVREPRLNQTEIAEQVVKEPFITPTTTITNDSFSLFIPIPVPLITTTFFSTFTSKRSNKYWIFSIPVSTYSSDGLIIPPTVLQILTIISMALRTRATPGELQMLYDQRNARYRRVVEEVFRRRCEKEDEDREREKGGTGTGSRGRNKKGGKGRQERIGIRRVDLLGTQTRWLGLEREKGVKGWVVRLGNMNLR